MTLQKMEIDATTGEEIYTELNTKEVSEYNAWIAAEAKKVTDAAAAIKDAEIKKAALLTKLGLTAADVVILLG